MKLARQYHLELSPKAPRVKFIARRGTWHGCTLATLSLGDFKPRKHPFESILHDNVSRVSPCHPYRGLRDGERHEDYVARLQQELEDEFQRLGPDTVCAFVVEPVVGTVRINGTYSTFELRTKHLNVGPWLCGSITRVFASHARGLSPSRGSPDLRRSHVWNGTYRHPACLGTRRRCPGHPGHRQRSRCRVRNHLCIADP